MSAADYLARELKVSPPKLHVLKGDSGKKAQREREAIAEALRTRVEGEVRFDNGSRALYATDLSVYRQVPIGVVIPRHAQDAIETVAVCRSFGVPILARGCGTSLAGQTCNVAVVIDFSKHVNHLLEMNTTEKWAHVQPGLICDQLRNAADAHGLTFGPDPATHAYCTLGGMIGNNSCGVHSVMAGRTMDNVHELEILTYDGLHCTVGATGDKEFKRIVSRGGRRAEIYQSLSDLRDRYAGKIRDIYPDIPRRVSGYNLESLLPENGFHVARALVGSESTCALVLSAKLRLVHNPKFRVLLVVGYPDIFQLGDEVALIRSFGPIGLECVQQHVLRNFERKGQAHEGSKLLPDGDAWLLAEFAGDSKDEAQDRANAAFEGLRKRHSKSSGVRLLPETHQQELIWDIREGCVGASRVPGEEDAWPSWEDAAVAPEVVGDYLREFYKLNEKYQYKWTIYGHFGDGCIHTRIAFDLKTREGVRNFRRFIEEAADLVVKYKGSLSGEHGDGQCRAELLPKMYGRDLMRAFHQFKSIWDPQWKMNPGKVIDPYKLDENLRLGPDYKPVQVKTHFQFPNDHGSMAEATERCFGIGKCRSLKSGTMCPSFQVTREEMHSTRGRAHLLFEMLRGDKNVITGWRDEHVKEALDLCLSCKGCKNDCPVNVDIATYKAEFLSHYWEGRTRPASAYAFGYLDRWARMASTMPGVANLLTQTPALAALGRELTGVAPQRSIPPFAPETLQHWFARQPKRKSERVGVLLFPDTFNNFFHPDIGRAAFEVLEAAGCDVEIPMQHLCCGRPLFDFGMLDDAKAYLRRVLRTLHPAIAAQTPIIVLEPSCASVFRDEMRNLFPNNEDARGLSNTVYLLSEFLEQTGRTQFPALHRKAVVHGHCHQKSVLDAGAMKSILAQLELDCDNLDSGCCGMAGSFGYEKEKYDVSIACGERVLLPAVRNAGNSTLIIADGFSCQEQIRQTTDREALHTAQVLQMALHQEDAPPPLVFPESEIVSARKKAVKASMAKASLITAATVGASAVAFLAGKFRAKNDGHQRSDQDVEDQA